MQACDSHAARILLPLLNRPQPASVRRSDFFRQGRGATSCETTVTLSKRGSKLDGWQKQQKLIFIPILWGGESNLSIEIRRDRDSTVGFFGGETTDFLQCKSGDEILKQHDRPNPKAKIISWLGSVNTLGQRRFLSPLLILGEGEGEVARSGSWYTFRRRPVAFSQTSGPRYSRFRVKKPPWAIDVKLSAAKFEGSNFVSNAREFMRHVDMVFTAVASRPELTAFLGIQAAVARNRYGWIELAPAVRDSAAFMVGRFWQKLETGLAKELFDRGRLWNSFVMVGQLLTLMGLFFIAVPNLYLSCTKIRSIFGTASETETVAAANRTGVVRNRHGRPSPLLRAEQKRSGPANGCANPRWRRERGREALVLASRTRDPRAATAQGASGD